jgi:uncharacterized protein YndB with AHSA1/START domain
MGPISASRLIDAPRERVFDFLSDLSNRPAFTDHFLAEFRLERLPSTGVGASARFRLTGPGIWAETVIEAVKHPYRILERGKGGRWDRTPMSTEWELVEGPSAETTDVTVTFWTDPSHPLDRLKEKLGAERRYRRQWTIALRRLQGVIEEDRPVTQVAVAGADRVPR